MTIFHQGLVCAQLCLFWSPNLAQFVSTGPVLKTHKKCSSPRNIFQTCFLLIGGNFSNKGVAPCVSPSCKVFNILAFKIIVKNRFSDNEHYIVPVKKSFSLKMFSGVLKRPDVHSFLRKMLCCCHDIYLQRKIFFKSQALKNRTGVVCRKYQVQNGLWENYFLANIIYRWYHRSLLVHY